MKLNIKNVLPGKIVQQALLRTIFKQLHDGHQDELSLAFAYAGIQSPAFDETTQHEKTKNNVLHEAASISHDAVAIVNSALIEKWESHSVAVIAGHENIIKDYSTKKEFTTGDVAKICDVAPRTVAKWMANGLLDGWCVPGSKFRRFERSVLIDFMKRRGMPLDNLMPRTAVSRKAALLDQKNEAGKRYFDLPFGKAWLELDMAA